MRKIYFRLSDICCYASFILLVTFISWYTVPPLIDFQGHVALGMLDPQGTLANYYGHHFGLTYRLFDNIVHFWYFFIGNDYPHVALASYVTFIFLILSTVYSSCIVIGINHSRTFHIIAILLGPIFLMLHSVTLIWGFIPCILSALMAIPSSIALWHMDDSLSQHIPIKFKTKIVFILYTALSIYSHITGFLFLSVAWTIPALRLIFINAQRKKRIILWFSLFIIMLYLFFVIVYFSENILTRNTPAAIIYHFNLTNPIKRLYWLITKGPYYLPAKFFISESQAGLLSNKFITSILTATPFIIFFSLFIRYKTVDLTIKYMILFQLAFAFILFFLLPYRWSELGALHCRYWLFICGFTWVGIAYWINLSSFRFFKILCCFSPILTAACCYILMPFYANFRNIPIEQTAKNYTQILLKTIKTYRDTHSEAKEKIIVLDYLFETYTLGGSWYQYSLVPVIMMLSPELNQQKIIIRNRWFHSKHTPLYWKSSTNPDTLYFYWNAEKANQIILEPCQLNKEENCIPESLSEKYTHLNQFHVALHVYQQK